MATYDIPKAAERMNLTPAYVRSLIRKGTLASTLEPLVPESLVKHHVIDETEIQRYQAGTVRKTHRADGRNKYVIYLSIDERDKMTALLKANGLDDVAATMRTWNPLKPGGRASVKVKKEVKHGAKRKETVPSI